jgi:hypothetical protein
LQAQHYLFLLPFLSLFCLFHDHPPLKFRKKLNTLKEVISTNEYVVSQSEQHLKNNKIKLDEWILKSTSEKAVVLSKMLLSLEPLISAIDF